MSSAVEQWNLGNRSRTDLLEELVLVQSDDIGKLNLDEVLLRYFEHKQKLGCDTWQISNPALRQLFSASRQAPRQRHFAGCERPKTPAPAPRRGSAPFSVKRRQPPDQQKLRRILQPPDQQTKQLAEHLTAGSDTYEDIERQLADLADQLVEKSLDSAVYNSAVHQLAAKLVRRAMQRVEQQLIGRRGEEAGGDERDSRVDAIAAGMAESHRQQL